MQETKSNAISHKKNSLFSHHLYNLSYGDVDQDEIGQSSQVIHFQGVVRLHTSFHRVVRAVV